MKSYPHIISKLFYEPLVLTRAKHAAICRVLESHMRLDASVIAIEPGAKPEDEKEPDYDQVLDTAVIEVHGILGKHLGGMEMMSGGCSLDMVSQMFSMAEEDEECKRIILDFNTPGGAVTGIPELARKIANCEKETIAFTDSECCSGGIWLASQCKKFFCTESATVGSIGVWCAYQDLSRMLQNEGVNIQPFEAGKYKTMGAYWKPLTKEESEMIQKSVDKIFGQFKAAVTRYREIPDQFMQGQCFDGQEAAEIGLVDGLVESMDDIMEDMIPEDLPGRMRG